MLREAGIEHEAIAPGVDDAELVPGVACGRRWAMSLAYLKARAGAARLFEGGRGNDCVVLGADTVCQFAAGTGGEVMIAPRDADDARRMLRAMRSREHDVLTGLAIVDASSSAHAATGDWLGTPCRNIRRAVLLDRSSVRWGHVEDAEIERYVASGLWRGKAGAYNLAERLADGWPIEVEGDPQGVMGLPIRRIPELLRAMPPQCCAA